MGHGKKLTAKKVRDYKQLYLDALEKFNGVDYLTIGYLSGNLDYDISWDYYKKKWTKEDELFKNQCDLIRANVKDWVVNKLYSLINDGNFQAIKLFLERKGGWVEESKQTIDNNININEPVKIDIIKPKDDKSNK